MNKKCQDTHDDEAEEDVGSEPFEPAIPDTPENVARSLFPEPPTEDDQTTDSRRC